jgi:cytochrome c
MADMRVLSMSAAALAVAFAADVRADPVEEGREAYRSACARCHGQILENGSAALGGAVWTAVMAPIGPNLTGIYGRPAGSVEGFRYSNAFQKATKDLVWDAETLDRWLADSQAMARGSYMFQKTAQPARSRIIEYLERRSRYRE